LTGEAMIRFFRITIPKKPKNLKGMSKYNREKNKCISNAFNLLLVLSILTMTIMTFVAGG